jgi:ubiquinone/menaquinone biosynthesis C-methylase UbiE
MATRGADLSYQEKADRLSSRIRAHKLFANFDVEEWIAEFLARRPRHDILDVGCGNGNHLGLYLKHVPADGSVVGLDREARLIEEARQQHAGAANLRLHVGSMDDRLPFPDETFDLCFSNFAIYNARVPRFTLDEVARVLRPGGEVVLIGPTRRNAFELYEYNERLTGEAIDPITLVRTDRLRQEIAPIVQAVFGEVTEEVLNSRLTFPDQDEFLRYFTATMLYEEGAEKRGVTREEMRAACLSERDIVVSKEMAALVAVKRPTGL